MIQQRDHLNSIRAERPANSALASSLDAAIPRTGPPALGAWAYPVTARLEYRMQTAETSEPDDSLFYDRRKTMKFRTAFLAFSVSAVLVSIQAFAWDNKFPGQKGAAHFPGQKAAGWAGQKGFFPGQKAAGWAGQKGFFPGQKAATFAGQKAGQKLKD